jgi:inosine/uridine nucleosidase
MPPPVLLDCDPGHDDAIAILLAAGRRDAIDLQAVTTVAGNAELDKVTLNAQRIMTLAGLDDVPLAAGAAGPLRGDLLTALDIHGDTGLDGAELPEPAVALDPRGAVELMAESGPATVVATGPLTNVAELLERAPETVNEIVWMGGSTERGNAEPAAEFNALVDPEAAEIVFTSGVPLTMVGLNLTHQALATGDVIDRLRAMGSPASEAAIGWLGFFADTYRALYGFEGPPVHDPCALALVIDPPVVRCVDAFVAIETEGRWTRGATVVDLHGRLGRGPNARVAMELDRDRFWDLVLGAIAAL